MLLRPDSAKHSPALAKGTLVQKHYRTLLSSDRSYAAYDTKAVNPLIDELLGKGLIIDPMSGYGSLTEMFGRKGISSVSVEICVPLYLWQLLRNRAVALSCTNALAEFHRQGNALPTIDRRGEVSNNWFTPEALAALKQTLESLAHVVRRQRTTSPMAAEVIAASLIVPFCSRLACCSESNNNPTWVKRGGIVVYRGWEDDFAQYVASMGSYLNKIASNGDHGINHKVILGDCREVQLTGMVFGGMLTSPPYPNRSDYHKMFDPEIAFCDALNIPGLQSYPATHYIGSTVVRDTIPKQVPIPSANEFLQYVLTPTGDDKKNRANRTYYYPYYANYFLGLLEAYQNISRFLADDFVGFVVVQNNHFRSREVPVAQAIAEIWRYLGYKATVREGEEVFHTGTLNPRARGTKAKQRQFTIRIDR